MAAAAATTVWGVGYANVDLDALRPAGSPTVTPTSRESVPGPLSAGAEPSPSVAAGSGGGRGGTRSTPPAGPTTAAPTQVHVPQRASGRLVTVPGRAGSPAPGRKVVYRLEIEAGLPFVGSEVARTVQRTLLDRRGWQGVEGVSFERTDGPAPIRLILASPSLTDELCRPLVTLGRLSCRVGERVVLNAMRWVTGIPAYAGRLDEYRSYMVNHEMGHALGRGHVFCPAAGALAPVMMQQTKGLGACRPNAWPALSHG